VAGSRRWFSEGLSECVSVKRWLAGWGFTSVTTSIWVLRTARTSPVFTSTVSCHWPSSDWGCRGRRKSFFRSTRLSIFQSGPANIANCTVSALTKPEDDFARRDPKTMNAGEFERWSCSPYVSSIAYSIKQILPGPTFAVFAG